MSDRMGRVESVWFAEKEGFHFGEEAVVFLGGAFAPGIEVFCESGSFFARDVGEGVPMVWFGFEEGKDEVCEGSVEVSPGGVFPECGPVFLVKGGGGLQGEGFPGFHDGVGIGGEALAVIFECFVGGVFLPMDAQLAEREERGCFAEGFLEPFVLVIDGFEVRADMTQFVGELVDELGVVAILAVELNGDFSFGSSLEKGDGAILVMGNEQGGILGFWKDFQGGLAEVSELPFFHEEAFGVDAQLLCGKH